MTRLSRVSGRTPFSLARCLRVAPIVVAGFLGACGQGAPDKADIQQVVQTYMQGVNQQTSDQSLGLFDGPYDPSDMTISNADCSALENGVYRCAVTAVTKKGTHTAQLNLKKVNGTWTLVEN